MKNKTHDIYYLILESGKKKLTKDAIQLLVCMLQVGNCCSHPWVIYSLKARGLSYLAKVQAR
jgi:hypothetical protein